MGNCQHLKKSGCPDGVFNLVMGRESEVGAKMVAYPGIDAISFTGSVSTGRRIAVQCAQTHKHICQRAIAFKNRTSLADEAADILREMILPNKLLPGMPLPEREIFAVLGISRTPLREATRWFGVEDEFAFVCGADSGYGVKPQAGMVLAFGEACGLRCGEVMMVGDSPRDLKMGRNAGVGYTVGVLTGAHGAADLALDADFVLGSIAELPGLLRAG